MSLIDQILTSALWQKFRRLKWWQQTLTVFGVFLLFLLFIDSIVMPWYTRHGDEYKLPDVTEKEFSQAKEILKKNGFIPIIQDSVYDSFYAPGIVIRQNPSSFSTVKKGRRVYLVLSSGEKPIVVPNLVTLTRQDAEFRLREAGMELNNIYWDFSDTHPYRGTVIKQSLPAGEKVTDTKKIDLTLSLGPLPSSQEVPALIGKSLDAAQKELEALNIPVGEIRLSVRPNLVPNTVIAQSVAEGTPIVNIQFIDLVVSTDRSPDIDDQSH